jgi:antitoxin PrlF
MENEKIMDAKLTSKGQITVPKGVREALDLDSSDTVSFVMQADGSILVRKKITKEVFWNKIREVEAEYEVASSPEVDWGEDVGSEVID